MQRDIISVVIRKSDTVINGCCIFRQLQMHIPIELNLICQFDNQDYFEGIFHGVNRYRFVKILPEIAHSYLRMLVLDKVKNCISYILSDLETKEHEIFSLHLDTNFQYLGANQFTGMEWWNKTGNFLYPLRYHVEISPMFRNTRYHNNQSDHNVLHTRVIQTTMVGARGILFQQSC
jgi:hypothetical protein